MTDAKRERIKRIKPLMDKYAWICSQRGISQMEIARRLECDVTGINRIMNCRTDPKLSTFLLLLGAIGMDLTDFVSWKKRSRRPHADGEREEG